MSFSRDMPQKWPTRVSLTNGRGSHHLRRGRIYQFPWDCQIYWYHGRRWCNLKAVSSRIHIDVYVCGISCETLQWRHNGHDSVSNHQPHVCLLSRLFRRRSKKISKLRVTGLCAGNSPETGELHMASNAKKFPFDDVIMTVPGECHQSWVTSQRWFR